VRLKSNFVHGIQAIVEGSLLAMIVVGLLAGAAFASGGPTKSSTSTISMVVVGTSGATGAATVQATYGGTITFDVATTATAYPFVNLKCYQNGVLVAQGWAGFFAGALGDEMFGLYSPQWTSGAADCTANLDMKVNTKWKVLASTSFHVSS
jgi:uncharacterized membrane protein YeaQ/YmgE (transglycosylase-associated protein family)